MDANWIDYIPWIYASVQVLITLIISIMGVKYVRNEFLIQKCKVDEQLQIAIGDGKGDDHDYIAINKQIKDTESKHDETGTQPHKSVQFKMMSKMGFGKLWFKIVWKMRSIYGALAVHLFDVLTDILVIISWFVYPDVAGDGVDPRVMAYCAISVLLFHKLISFAAFWAKEKNMTRCMLQVFDLLIFEEIYVSHQRVVSQFQTKSKELDEDSEEKVKGEEAIETTSTFKFVRNLEAVFEAIPQAVLQLVFIIRTGWKSDDGESGNSTFVIISILSIFQSIISMTNSIIKNDNMYMTLPKWKKHKKRLPPTIPFMKHFISRFSEVVYRISLCSLFWVVCGGLPFGILICVEFIFLAYIFMSADWNLLSVYSGIEDAFLRVQALIIMPSELVYALPQVSFIPLQSTIEYTWKIPKASRYEQIGFFGFLGLFCSVCTCCCGPAVLLTTLCTFRKDYYGYMTMRIGMSMLEWFLIIIWPFFDGDRVDYLYSFDHGLVILIVSIVCYLIYTQYLSFFPNFELPHRVPIRSVFGYAFNGELEELQRFQTDETEVFTPVEWNDNPSLSVLPWNGETKGIQEYYHKWDNAFYGRLEEMKQKVTNPNYYGDKPPEPVEDDFRKQKVYERCIWSYPDTLMTPAMLALSNKQFHVVKYLEEQQAAKLHERAFSQQSEFPIMDHLFARKYLMRPPLSFWNQTFGNTENITMVLLALSNKQYHVVDWLIEEQKVVLPDGVDDARDYKGARWHVGQEYFND